MTDRSEQVRQQFQAELHKNDDPATIRIKNLSDGNEEFYQVYLHREGEDRFTEFHIFTTFDKPIEIPPYQRWWE